MNKQSDEHRLPELVAAYRELRNARKAAGQIHMCAARALRLLRQAGEIVSRSNGRGQSRAELARRMLPKVAELAPRAWTPDHDCALVSAIARGAWGDELAQMVADVRPGVSFSACRDRFALLRRSCRMPGPRLTRGAA